MNEVLAGLRDRCFVGDIFNLALFADLLVLECCKVIEQHDEPTYDGTLLRQHFGVSDDPPR